MRENMFQRKHSYLFDRVPSATTLRKRVARTLSEVIMLLYRTIPNPNPKPPKPEEPVPQPPRPEIPPRDPDSPNAPRPNPDMPPMPPGTPPLQVEDSLTLAGTTGSCSLSSGSMTA